MRKKNFNDLQLLIRSTEAEIHRQVWVFRQRFEGVTTEWQQLRGRARERTEDEKRTLDRACEQRYRFLKELGLVE